MRNTMIKKLLLNQGKYETVQGIPPLTLEKSLGKDLRDYKIYGNSIQNGTPTPDTPVEVESVGDYDEATGKYKIPVVVSGKNLFTTNKPIGTQGLKYTILSDNSCEIVTNGSVTARYINFSSFTLRKHTNYCFGFTINSSGDTNNISDNRIYIWGRNTGGSWTFITASGAVRGNLTNRVRYHSFNTGDYDEIRLSYYPVVSGGVDLVNYTATLTNIQLELGTTTTDFEPYLDETYTTNIYLDEPLHRVGDYADTIDFGNGKVVKRVAIQEFNGSETWVKHTTTSEGYGVFRSDNLLTPLINSPNSATFMTHAILTDKGATADFIPGEYRFTASNGLIIGSRLYVGAAQTTVDEYKQWLSENKPKLYYPIAIPTEEYIELPKLLTLKGTTVLDTKTNLALSNMSVVYKRR